MGAIKATRMNTTAICRGRMVSGATISSTEIRPKQSPAVRRPENRSIPSSRAIGKANIGTVEIKIAKTPLGKCTAAS